MDDYKAVLELLFGDTEQGSTSFNNNDDQRTTRDSTTDKGNESWNPIFCVYQGGEDAKFSFLHPIHVMVDISLSRIPDNAFFRQDYLLSIAFPRELRHIGDRAFDQCRSLTTIVIPPLVETIGRSAFSDCTSLVHVDCSRLDDAASSSLRSLHDGCFSGCRSLERINLPSSISDIGKRAFYNCSKLPKMDLSACDGLTRIESQTFGFCTALTNCRLPSRVTEIGISAFGQCYELRSINIGESRQAPQLLVIGDEAFASCRSLRVISLPSSLERIGKRAFANCFGLITAEVAPNNRLQKIGGQIFFQCKRLVNIVLPEDIAHSRLLKHGVFEGCTDLNERFAPFQGLLNETFLREALCIRYDASPLHQLCYHQAHMTVEKSMEELEKIVLADEGMPKCSRFTHPSLWVDIFQMSPIHVLVASSEANPDLLQGILKHSSHRQAPEENSMPTMASILLMEDLWGRIPLHLACLNDSLPITIIEILLRSHSSHNAWNLALGHWKSCIDAATYNRREVLPLLIVQQFEKRIASLRSPKWRQELMHRIENIEMESASASRCSISSIEGLLNHYEKLESIALVRSAVWKVKLKELGNGNDLVSEEERNDCLIHSGDEVVTSCILPFSNLNITQRISGQRCAIGNNQYNY